VERAESAPAGAFDRVLDLFDRSNESAMAQARRRWKATKDGDHGMTYWQQGARLFQAGHVIAGMALA